MEMDDDKINQLIIFVIAETFHGEEDMLLSPEYLEDVIRSWFRPHTVKALHK